VRPAPADLPRRDPCESEALTLFGRPAVRIAVLRQAGVRKDGEVRYRRLVTTYLVERPRPGAVRFVKDSGEAYTVTAAGCDCKDAKVRGFERLCKHFTSCEQQGWLPGGTDREQRPAS
jgi:hypothetical protein